MNAQHGLLAHDHFRCQVCRHPKLWSTRVTVCPKCCAAACYHCLRKALQVEYWANVAALRYAPSEQCRVSAQCPVCCERIAWSNLIPSVSLPDSFRQHPLMLTPVTFNSVRFLYDVPHSSKPQDAPANGPLSATAATTPESPEEPPAPEPATPTVGRFVAVYCENAPSEPGTPEIMKRRPLLPHEEDIVVERFDEARRVAKTFFPQGLPDAVLYGGVPEAAAGAKRALERLGARSILRGLHAAGGGAAPPPDREPGSRSTGSEDQRYARENAASGPGHRVREAPDLGDSANGTTPHRSAPWGRVPAPVYRPELAPLWPPLARRGAPSSPLLPPLVQHQAFHQRLQDSTDSLYWSLFEHGGAVAPDAAGQTLRREKERRGAHGEATVPEDPIFRILQHHAQWAPSAASAATQPAGTHCLDRRRTPEEQLYLWCSAFNGCWIPSTASSQHASCAERRGNAKALPEDTEQAVWSARQSFTAASATTTTATTTTATTTTPPTTSSRESDELIGLPSALADGAAAPWAQCPLHPDSSSFPAIADPVPSFQPLAPRNATAEPSAASPPSPTRDDRRAAHTDDGTPADTPLNLGHRRPADALNTARRERHSSLLRHVLKHQFQRPRGEGSGAPAPPLPKPAPDRFSSHTADSAFPGAPRALSRGVRASVGRDAGEAASCAALFHFCDVHGNRGAAESRTAFCGTLSNAGPPGRRPGPARHPEPTETDVAGRRRAGDSGDRGQRSGPLGPRTTNRASPSRGVGSAGRPGASCKAEPVRSPIIYLESPTDCATSLAGSLFQLPAVLILPNASRPLQRADVLLAEDDETELYRFPVADPHAFFSFLEPSPCAPSPRRLPARGPRPPPQSSAFWNQHTPPLCTT